MATEKELRNKLVSTAAYYLGTKQNDAQHKAIIDIFNQVKPDGWAMTYSAYWCAAFASACAIKAFGIDKAKKYFPLSANCGTIVSKAKKMGIWVENDAYTPKPGDWILYDWDDSGKGDNVGGPDHVGIVENVVWSKMEIIEGNYSKAVKERTLNVNGFYIRGFVTPKYSAMATSEKRRSISSLRRSSRESGEQARPGRKSSRQPAIITTPFKRGSTRSSQIRKKRKL